MGNTPHELAEEFPDMAGRIHALKTSDSRFARLVEEYHEVNRQIHRIETRVEPASEDVEEEFKRRRVRLKDEIAQMLEGSDVAYSDASPVRADPAASPRLRGGF
ncbi:MAG TPA: YdcH family protein [Beijerinckiaceae bacterium]|nr:YdcH family protein [Beijerinckiaceae bacterium]